MFIIKSYQTIVEKEKKYISFPDVIQSKKYKNKLFLVYREGNAHHPRYSILYFLISEDYGKTWEQAYKFHLSMSVHGKVWNCPRLSYFPDGSLNIVCDTKDSTNEKVANFEVYILKSLDDGITFIDMVKTEMTGMLPDHVISFKNNLYCANHITDKQHNTLTQLVNFSRDKGKTWYDRSIIARSNGGAHNTAYCEASIVNYKDKYLMAYIRDNRGGAIRMPKFISYDGQNWSSHGKLSFCGHRPTALLKKNRLFISFRNTKDITISVMTAILDNKGKEKQIESIEIDKETSFLNKYHFGYTGLVKCEGNAYLIVYYIQGKKRMPYIKSCFFEWKK